ncbi:Ig-like domain-containing protein [Cellulomonas sp. URHB0016]
MSTSLHTGRLRRALAAAGAAVLLVTATAAATATTATAAVAPVTSSLGSSWASPVAQGGDDGHAVYVLRPAGQRYATGSIAVTDDVTGSVTTTPLDEFGAVWFVPNDLLVGDHELTFQYSGDDLYSPSSLTRTVTVTGPLSPGIPAKGRPRMTMTGTESALPGATPEYTLHVTGSGPVPTGTVSVFEFDGDVPYTSEPVELQDGSAVVHLPAVTPGRHVMSASYSGDSQYLGAHQAHDVIYLVVPVTVPGGEPDEPPVPVPAEKGDPLVETPATVTTAVGTPARFRVLFHSPVRQDTTVTVREGSTVLAQVGRSAAADRAEVTLPVLAPGTHTLTVSTPESDSLKASQATVALVVSGEPTRATEAPTGTLSAPADVVVGAPTTLEAHGYTPGETVAFYLHSDPVLLGTAVADAQGVARLVVTLPAGVPAGAHHVLATGGTSGVWAELPVTVTAAAAPGTPTPAATGTATLAATGAQTGSLVAVALLALALGGGLVVARRRAQG